MAFELVVPRLFSPYFGTSTYIWTLILGVVMASLSVGYFVGGKLADVKSDKFVFVSLLLMASLFTFFVWFYKDSVINGVFLSGNGVFESCFKASIIILTPINILLGALTPVAAKSLSFTKNNSGSIVGNIYAFSTLGSILGTFTSGFWLIPTFGIHNILFYLSLVLLGCTFVVASLRVRVLLLFFFIAYYFIFNRINLKNTFADFYHTAFDVNIVADIDTKYDRIWIYDQQTHIVQPSRILANSQSEMYLYQTITEMMRGSRSYFSYFNLATHYNPEIKNALMIGGGAYTYASYILDNYPDIKLDVAEIDPDLLAISEKYFRFNPTANFHNYSMDGRVFLNNNKKQYDVIFLDAYRNGDAIPFQLSTKQAYQHIYDSLSDNGLVFINIISSINGKGSKLFKSEYLTLDAVFDQVLVFPIWDRNVRTNQNIVLVGRKGDKVFNNKLSESEDYLKKLNLNSMDVSDYLKGGKIFSDDYAPVEYFDFERF